MSDVPTIAIADGAPRVSSASPASPAPKRERDVRFDVLKAVAIFLVVLGHSITLVYGNAMKAPFWMGTIFTIVSAVNVPLFMFISGYLTRTGPSAKWVGQRAMRLLVPYVAWTILVFLAMHRAEGLWWFPNKLWIPQNDNGLWFLYVLFVLCVLWWAISRSKVAIVLALVVCFTLPVDTVLGPYSRFFGMWIICSQFPVFIAGWWFAQRGRFDPKWWVLPLAAGLLVVVWTVPGFNPMYAIPTWSVRLAETLGTAGWVVDPVRVLVRVLRLALEVSLVASAFWIARNLKHGAWIGALTLGIYASHQFFMPRWLGRTGNPFDVVVAFSLVTTAAVGTALLLDKWQTTRFLLLGGGKLPGWMTGKRRSGPHLER